MRILLSGFFGLFSLILTATTVQAKTCDLQKDISATRLDLLKQATRLHYNDIIGINMNEYAVNILNNETTGQYIVILGEIHIKKPRASKIGKAILKEFPIRFLEGVPEREAKELKDVLGWKRDLVKVLTFRFKGSTIHDARSVGLAIYPGDNKTVSLDKKTLKPYADSPVWSSNDVENVLSSVNPLLLTKEISLPLEVGTFLQPSESDHYILTRRNERMKDNMVAYMRNVSSEQIPLAVVGAAHNPGLTNLMAREGFENCSNF